jgi:ABC-2 type transport system ATP-binding protein
VRYNATQSLLPDARPLRAGEYECELDQAALPEFLAHLTAHGGHLLSVQPAVSLESLFFRILEEAAQPV